MLMTGSAPRIRRLRSWCARATLLYVGAHIAAAVASPDHAALRQRAAELFERREAARREGGISLDQLQANLLAVADSLEAAGLDSLAAGARYRAGGVLVRLNRGAEAQAQLQLAIVDARRAGDSTLELSVQSYLADLQVRQDPDAALVTIQALIPRLEGLGSENQLGAARSTEARAWMALGRARESLVAARRAAAHYRKAGNRNGEAYALTQASQALRFLDRHAEALEVATGIIGLGQQANIGRTLARAYLERASCLRALGRIDEGLAATDLALATDRRLGEVQHMTSVRRFRVSLLLEAGRFAECKLEADTLLTLMLDPPDATGALFAASMRAAAQLGLGSRSGMAATLLPHIEAHEEFRRSLTADEDVAASAEHSHGAYTILARVLLAEGRTADAWRASERGRAVALKRQLGIAAVPELDELLTVLDRSRAALIQFEGIDNLAGTVYVLADRSVRGWPLAREISRDDLELMRARLGPGGSGALDDPVFARVSRALLTDVWSALPRDIERLVIVPPGVAPDLALEALPGPEGSGVARLTDRWALSYTPAAALLPLLVARQARSGPTLVLADPVVETDQEPLAGLDPALRGRVARPLPAARDEARQLGRRGAIVLTGREATLDRLLGHDPGVLHFATHALEDPRIAPRGALVLAGEPALLTAAAVESLGVRADLVSLSACRTLGSVHYSGEGAFGLARAFLAAGARSVVTTRWEVGDRAAARMMELFYEGLQMGLARDQALARAGHELEREAYPARDRWAFLLLGVGSLPMGASDGR